MQSNGKNLAAVLTSMAETCSSMQSLKQIHGHAIRTNLHNHSIVLAKIFRFAAVSPAGDLLYAHRLFDEIPQPNTFFYNILIRGYSNSSSPSTSISLYNQMRKNRIDHDGFTFTFLLKARSKMKTEIESHFDEIHSAVMKTGLCSYLYVMNGLINLYAVRGEVISAQRVFDEGKDYIDVVSWSGLVVAYIKAGELDRARGIFERMPEKDVVSWTAMVSGYAQAKRSVEAIKLFKEMSDDGVKPDEVTMISVISACTNLGDIELGSSLHRYIDENRFEWMGMGMVSLCNALIDMYAKCGCMGPAWRVFDSVARKSLITWNTMISACANQGDAEDAFGLFESLLESRVSPDGVTFLALLTACTHKGMVEEGYRLFESMERDYGVRAGVEHYGCLVDLLGRAGRVDEAYRLITSMPISGNDIVWGALLAACRIYGDVDMGEKVVKKLIELKPDEGGYYILLRDIYVAGGRTVEANEIRQSMIDNGARKTPGCSWVGGSMNVAKNTEIENV